MISRFQYSFSFYSAPVFPWLILIFKSEKQLLTLAPAPLSKKNISMSVTLVNLTTHRGYAAYISETGGDVKALKVADTAVPEWKAKNNTRAKARQPLLGLKRNVDGEPAYPHYEEALQLMAKPSTRHKAASIAIPNR